MHPLLCQADHDLSLVDLNGQGAIALRIAARPGVSIARKGELAKKQE
jgi:hypothetical protein